MIIGADIANHPAEADENESNQQFVKKNSLILLAG